MKTYEKPKLMALSLSGNEQLCGSCADEGNDLLSQDPTGMDAQIIDEIAGNNDGRLTKEETINLFGNGECKCGVDFYCKFQSVGDKLVAWS